MMVDFLASMGHVFGVDMDWRHAQGRRFTITLAAIAVLCGIVVALLSPWKAFAVLTGSAFVALAFARPQLIVLFLAVYTPFEPFLLKFVGDDIYVYARYFSEGLIYVLCASAVARLLLRRKKYAPTALDLPFLFFLLVAVASLVVNSVSPVVGILGLRQIVRFILLFFVVVVLEPPKEYMRMLTTVMLAIVVFEGILGAVQSVVGGPLDEFLIPSERKFFESIQLTSGVEQFWSPGTRVFATLGRYDQLGTFLCFFLLLVVGFLYQKSSAQTRRGLGTALILAVPALILTLSRASWFGMILGVGIIGAVLMRDWRIRASFVAALVAIILYAGYTGIVVKYLTEYPGQTPVERLFEAFSYERWRGEYYGLGRLYWMVQTPLVVVRSSPLFGVGPGSYGGGAAAALGNTSVYERLNLPFGVYGTEGYIDNNWFSLWGETGTLGLIFYVWMFVALGRVALDLYRKSDDPFTKGLALGYVGALAAVAFQSLLATYLEVRTLALYVWLYGAFIYVLARREKVVVAE